MIGTLLSYPLSLSVYAALFIALISIWLFPKSYVWLVFTGIATVLGLYSGRLSWVGFCFEVILGTACYFFYHLKTYPILKPFLAALIIGISYLMKTHELPGFYNWMIQSKFFYSPDSRPDSLYLNFDSSLTGLFILGWGFHPISTLTEWWKMIKKTLPLVLLAIAVMIGPSLLSGYVKFDFKWFDFSPIWLAVNLVFTCFVEEGLFRHFLQGSVQNWMSRFFGDAKAVILALIFASIVFGLFHYRGNWLYVALATLAGLLYGFAYIKTSKLESSILVHFAVNAIHFLMFSYPALNTQVLR